jgi:D-beta-D-heptose 7-phosphate kinase/D-beta-D-heptose 1-phosphate adenosyltransferase
MALMFAAVAELVPRLKRFVPRMHGKGIGVVRDLMLDRYLWGTASRLSPEAAVPVVNFVEQSERVSGRSGERRRESCGAWCACGGIWRHWRQ